MPLLDGQVTFVVVNNTVGESSNDDEPISFRIVLQQYNLDALTNLFWEVSNPQSDAYGSFLTVDEINTRVGSDADVQSVLEWLQHWGINTWVKHSNTIKVRKFH